MSLTAIVWSWEREAERRFVPSILFLYSRSYVSIVQIGCKSITRYAKKEKKVNTCKECQAILYWSSGTLNSAGVHYERYHATTFRSRTFIVRQGLTFIIVRQSVYITATYTRKRMKRATRAWKTQTPLNYGDVRNAHKSSVAFPNGKFSTAELD